LCPGGLLERQRGGDVICVDVGFQNVLQGEIVLADQLEVAL
jgi:hypothetical protein